MRTCTEAQLYMSITTPENTTAPCTIKLSWLSPFAPENMFCVDHKTSIISSFNSQGPPN